uniref:Uncharacterized protein n=1 Tax=Gasterosteus aculeatus aculeatus TaxID=481459 RepID=A0AAQ4R7Q0_GASAC
MANPHRTNVLVTSCLRTPVDPHTRAPLASYERRRARPNPATRRQGNREVTLSRLVILDSISVNTF